MLPPWMAQLMAQEEARRTRYQVTPGETQGISPGDSFIQSHLSGYGQVDAPSPWGYNRDTFNQEHPNYAGGYYNPASGFYDAPTEVPFTASGPGGPVQIGTGGPPMPLAPSEPGTGSAMDYGIMSPESSGSMPGAQPDHQPDEAPPAPAPSWSDFISSYAENAATSNGS